jgi:hypothetical protein
VRVVERARFRVRLVFFILSRRRLLYCCFIAALLLLYCCFTAGGEGSFLLLHHAAAQFTATQYLIYYWLIHTGAGRKDSLFYFITPPRRYIYIYAVKRMWSMRMRMQGPDAGDALPTGACACGCGACACACRDQMQETRIYC